MISQTLCDARKFEEEAEKRIGADERPLFHLSPRTGWMNDPNGFSFYGGKYHLFYQYYPFETTWGPMHWGHAVSTDLLHWTYLPAALAPDQLYDEGGCFSGGAVTLEDGRHLLVYTGVRKEQAPDGSETDVQTQCLAVGDGVNYEKWRDNPVLTEDDLPEGASRVDFRDPRVWREPDGSYRAMVGSRPADGSGQLLIFKSRDGFAWSFDSILAKNENRFGKMWECPDYFELDGCRVILTSPQDMLPKGFEYHNGNGTLCLIGRYDDETKSFVPEHDQAIDYGIDFYAPQTVLTQDGRRVMIGWLQNWDTCLMRHPDHKWFGQMSVPRELSVKDGRLYQQPLRELALMHREKVEYRNILLSGILELEGVCGRTIDLAITLENAVPDEMYEKFELHFAAMGDIHTSLSYKPKESVLKIDRKFSGSRRAIIHQRRAKIPFRDGRLKLRLILDRFSAEVFVNDGEQVMSCTLFTGQEARGISFFAAGNVRMDVECAQLG